ncbi:MAG: hypothetical protein RSB41_03725 [Bacilli bacterium]
MENNLPEVFINNRESKVNNNSSLFYSKEDKISNNIQNNNIIAKIDKIFSSSNFIYSSDVIINNVRKVKIISKNKYNLLTIDNELIKISDILDIREI